MNPDIDASLAKPRPAGSWSERQIDKLSRWIVGHPLLSMLFGLLLVVAGAGGLGGYHYSLDHRVFFSAENPQLQAFEKLHQDYAKTDAVIIALAPQAGSVFTREFLGVLRDLTEKSWQLPYSQRVESLTNFQHVQVAGDSIETADLVAEPAKLDAAALAEIRRAALAEPFLVNALVNPEGTVAGVRVTLNMPGIDQIKEVPEVVFAIRALVAELQKAHPDIEVHLAGQTIANQAFPEESQADAVRVWPWFMLTMMLLLVYFFRSVKAMLVTFVACLLAVFGGAGVIGFFAPTINDSVIVAPIMILSMAFADGIHLVVNWIQGMHGGRDKRTAMVDSLRANIGAMSVTSLMTAVGFLTLHFNDSPPFRVMGYIVAAGVIFALLITLFITAPLLAILPGQAPKKISPLMSADSPQMGRLADFVIKRRYPIFATLLLLAGLLISCVPRNQINDDIVKYYTPNTTFRQDMEFVNQHLTGIAELNYSLPAGGPEQISDPAYLKTVDAFQQWLKTQGEVTQVNSLVDIIKRMNQVMHGDDPAFYRIPDSREEIAQYLLQYELSMPFGMDLNYLIRFDRSESRVRVAVGTSSGQRIIAVDAAAKAWLQQHAPAAMQVEGASLSLMFAHIGERSITGMFGGMLGSLLMESLFVMLVFGAWRLGLASFIGNLIPIGMAFGAWALLNGNIDLGLTVVLGISFSVVVDDTIHFISKYEHARKTGLGPEDAIRAAFRNVGFALLTTTLVLGLGFAWLANSAIQITVNTAVVIVITIAFAMLVDLFLLPIIFLFIDKRDMSLAVAADSAVPPVAPAATPSIPSVS
ncbi:MAG: MMPL family transporter [Pseudomonas sp.]|uniref:efflux RND transporter permease subunit n=1 Tax=Pseudomonas sp. TaxID=306 RepID=UPI0027349A33|nr:MMPL family transporter [Pseudomonas sp.]MDP3847858.1 MMPL family transporter [Pseudomonas sp.]